MQLAEQDREPYLAWLEQFQNYLDSNRGGVPAEVTYALQHPEYLQGRPELQEGYDIASGSILPASVRDGLGEWNTSWTGGDAGHAKKTGLWDHPESWMQAILGGTLGGVAAAPAFAGGGGVGASGTGSGIAASSGASQGMSPLLGMGASAGTGGGAVAPVAAGAAGGSKGILSKLFGKGGLDPTAMALGGLSLLGGDGEFDDPRKSLAGTTSDPVKRMTEALDAIKGATSGLQSKPAFQLRGYQPPTPVAVNAPTGPFQVGGGLGKDPSLRAALEAENPLASFPDLFGGEGGALPTGYNPSPKKAHPR
jgi:hypothetical protein